MLFSVGSSGCVRRMYDLELYRGTFALLLRLCLEPEPEDPVSSLLPLLIMDVLDATDEEFRSLIVRFCIGTLYRYKQHNHTHLHIHKPRDLY